MPHLRTVLLVLAFVVAPIAQAQKGVPPLKGEIYADVLSVDDGDTMAVVVNGLRHKVRLSDVDAPETGSCKAPRLPEGKCARPGQRYGLESARALSSLVLGRQVRLRCASYDSRYSRSVCRVHVDGIDVNLRLVESGMAWFNKKYSSDRALAHAERVARARGLGLWSDRNVVAPWDWRSLCWKQAVC